MDQSIEKYSGKNEILCEYWMSAFETLTGVMGVEGDHAKVITLMSNLTGDALNFYCKDILPRIDGVTWEACKASFINHFSPNSTGNLMQNVNAKFAKLEKQLADCNGKITLLQQQFENYCMATENKLDQNAGSMLKCNLPIGFIYMQLPGQHDPNILWPGTIWTNITHKYFGLFYRGNAGAQNANNGTLPTNNSPWQANNATSPGNNVTIALNTPNWQQNVPPPLPGFNMSANMIQIFERIV